MKSKGIYFSFDFLVAFILLLLCLLLILQNTSALVEKTVLKQKETQLTMTGLFLLDSLIKNRDDENPLMGAAFFNADLKRVEQNTVDLELLSKITQKNDFEEFFLKSVYVKYKNFEKKYLLEKNEGKNCFGVERFVLIKTKTQTKKGKIGAEICNEK